MLHVCIESIHYLIDTVSIIIIYYHNYDYNHIYYYAVHVQCMQVRAGSFHKKNNTYNFLYNLNNRVLTVQTTPLVW